MQPKSLPENEEYYKFQAQTGRRILLLIPYVILIAVSILFSYPLIGYISLIFFVISIFWLLPWRKIRARRPLPMITIKQKYIYAAEINRRNPFYLHHKILISNITYIGASRGLLGMFIYIRYTVEEKTYDVNVPAHLIPRNNGIIDTLKIITQKYKIPHNFVNK